MRTTPAPPLAGLLLVPAWVVLLFVAVPLWALATWREP
jgi:hypothetical protein